MAKRSLGELEFIVLAIASRLGKDAYGAAIRRDVIAETRRDYSIGAIYSSLRRLEDKRFLESFESDPLPIRGGRSRRQFVLTAAGRAELRRTMDAKRRFWQRLTLAARPR